MKNITEMIDKYLVNEGTWAQPDTVEKAKKLESLMKKPLSKKDAETKLKGLIGNDDFFDSMDDAFRKGEDNKDVRSFIKDWLKNNWLTPKGQKTFVKKWDDKALQIVKNIIK